MLDLPREERLAAAFVDVAEILVGDFDVIHFLHILTEHCVDLLDVAAAGVLLATPDGDVVEAAASDDATRRLELAGVGWAEGPCHDCYREGTPITEARLDTAAALESWPRFVPRALELGYTSVVAVPLRLHDHPVGALNLFRDRPDPMDAGRMRLSQALANTAAIGILQQRTPHASTTVATQLRHALDSRIVIEQAKGYLAERGGIDVDTAFARLRAYARAHDMRLGEVALRVLDGSIEPPLPRP